MKNSITSTIFRFSAARMVRQYAEELYFPAAGIAPDVGSVTEARPGEEERATAPIEAGTRS
jgi:hypothetical protein